MLRQLEQLCIDTEGRYATDAELVFFQDYLRTARLRFLTYQKIQKLEGHIIQQVLDHLKRTDPALLIIGGVDVTAKWQRDTVRILRYAATALLTDDPVFFKEKILLWFRTIMRSFNGTKSCDETYRSMQTVVKQEFSVEESALLCPLLEMSRVILGEA